MIWTPHVTVAAVIERQGKFLFIEEEDEGVAVFNQPAGHWEPGETLLEASIREALEESACRFVPRHLVGIYGWKHQAADITYLRFAFCGEIEGFEEGRALDKGILGTAWLSAQELRSQSDRLRSPLVLRCIEDYAAGKRYPLDLVEHVL
ncbi:MAG: NUDIX hydrolase [Burkholderiales bacterium]